MFWVVLCYTIGQFAPWLWKACCYFGQERPYGRVWMSRGEGVWYEKNRGSHLCYIKRFIYHNHNVWDKIIRSHLSCMMTSLALSLLFKIILYCTFICIFMEHCHYSILICTMLQNRTCDLIKRRRIREADDRRIKTNGQGVSLWIISFLLNSNHKKRLDYILNIRTKDVRLTNIIHTYILTEIKLRD